MSWLGRSRIKILILIHYNAAIEGYYRYWSVITKEQKKREFFWKNEIFRLQSFWVCNISSCKNEYIFGYLAKPKRYSEIKLYHIYITTIYNSASQLESMSLRKTCAIFASYVFSILHTFDFSNNWIKWLQMSYALETILCSFSLQ